MSAVPEPFFWEDIATTIDALCKSIGWPVLRGTLRADSHEE
jgi:hypothetical protein